MMLAMLSKTCQTRGNQQFQLMMLTDANQNKHNFGHVLEANDNAVPTEYDTTLTQSGNPPKMGPKVKKWRFSELFFSILALALHQPCRVRHFFAYSCSHRPYGSNGVSHDPNPAREKSLGGPEVGPVVKFWAQNFSKCLKKLQTAISRPLLVQMS